MKLTRTSSKVRVFTKPSETSEQWPERVEVLRKVETVETTSTMRRATQGVKQSKEDWDGDKSTTKCHEQNDSRLWAKQSKKGQDKSTTSRATRGVEQIKARKIETETCLQQAERLEALRKTKPDLRLTHRQLVNKEKCNVSAPWGRFNYLTDNTATVHPNT